MADLLPVLGTQGQDILRQGIKGSDGLLQLLDGILALLGLLELGVQLFLEIPRLLIGVAQIPLRGGGLLLQTQSGLLVLLPELGCLLEGLVSLPGVVRPPGYRKYWIRTTPRNTAPAAARPKNTFSIAVNVSFNFSHPL